MSGRLRCLLLAVTLFGVAVTEASAQASSGGYTRAPMGGSGGGGYQTRRPPIAPGTGGYARPSFGGGGYSTGSAGDLALSRRSAQEALTTFRARQRAAQEPGRRPSPSPSPSPSPWGDGGYGAPPADLRRPPGDGWPVPSGRSGPSVSGPTVWDAALAWALLGALSSSTGRAGYFQDHRDDPGYQRWRQEAERTARNDPAVAANLRDLDARLAQPPAPPPRQDSGLVWVVIPAGGALLAGLWLLRRRDGRIAASPPRRVGRFRVGMVIPADPTPFLLAAGATKVRPPDGSGMLTVEAVGTLRGGPVFLQRLYLAAAGFFQVHLGADGMPDECRYFSQIDEVAPSTAEDWRFWLDPAGGTIGWPAFQTKDGKSYGRVWNAGSVPVPPLAFDEAIERVSGTAQRSHQAMLYAAATGAAAPAPQTEYVLVDAMEDSSGAFVGIYAGIDVNPAALNLPAIPLTEQRSAA